MSNTVTAPFQPHSAASRAAAQQIAPRLNSIRQRVYDFIAANPHCTDHDIRDGLGLGGNTARPRRIELETRELIQCSGVRELRGDGHLGALAYTWEIVPGKVYPRKWKTAPIEVEAGAARVRRQLNRAFPKRRPAIAALLDQLVLDVLDGNNLRPIARQLRVALTDEEFERIIQSVIV